MANETSQTSADILNNLDAEGRARAKLQELEGKESRGELQKGIGTSPSEPHERMLRFFRYEHLKPELQGASKPFCELARWLCATQGPSPERTKSLNALVEAKDWAVRALVPE